MELRMGLGIKLSSVIFIMMLSSSALIIYLAPFHSQKSTATELAYTAQTLSSAFALAIAAPLAAKDSTKLQSLAQALVDKSKVVESVSITLPNGKTFNHTKPPSPESEALYTYKETILGQDKKIMAHLQVGLKISPPLPWYQPYLYGLVIASILQALGTTLVVLLYVRRLITLPLRQLTQEAALIGEGKLSEPIKLNRTDEIGALSIKMDKMRANLNDLYNEILQHYATLDQRVDERTAELKEKNRMLEETRCQLIQSEKMATVGVLAAGVAHEINNPVSYISANLLSLESALKALDEIIKAYEAQDVILNKANLLRPIEELKSASNLSYLREDLPDLLASCKKGVSQIGETVKELMTFSRRKKQCWEVADIQECIDSTLNLIRSEIHQLEKGYQPLPKIRCIPSQLSQVFLNLLINAIHASDKDGKISISTAVVDKWVEVRVSDTGTGIPVEIRDKIFEPFFTTKPEGVGTGLGLAVSYDIIKKHKGDMKLDPHYKEGCCFIILLPITD